MAVVVACLAGVVRVGGRVMRGDFANDMARVIVSSAQLILTRVLVAVVRHRGVRALGTVCGLRALLVSPASARESGSRDTSTAWESWSASTATAASTREAVGLAYTDWHG